MYCFYNHFIQLPLIVFAAPDTKGKGAQSSKRPVPEEPVVLPTPKKAKTTGRVKAKAVIPEKSQPAAAASPLPKGRGSRAKPKAATPKPSPKKTRGKTIKAVETQSVLSKAAKTTEKLGQSPKKKKQTASKMAKTSAKKVESPALSPKKASPRKTRRNVASTKDATPVKAKAGTKAAKAQKVAAVAESPKGRRTRARRK